MKKIGIVMGSKSDLAVVKPAYEIIKEFGVECVVRVLSAHRTPTEACEFSENAEKEGICTIIAAAGKAAHLAGVIAGHTTLPVIGLPIKSSTMDGLDSLLSTVQMPNGIPVATVAINAGVNAGLLAIQILALSDEILSKKLKEYKQKMRDGVLKDDAAILGELN